MGYRSDVKSLIYGTNAQLGAFIDANHDLYKKVREDFNGSIKDIVKKGLQDKDLSIIYLKDEYTKWYDEYEEVQRWHELLDLAEQDGLSTEFIRIGESSEGDLEVYQSGDDCVYYLETEMKIVTVLDDEV
jgi:hypothetical protein